ncbi:methyltransferase domain-containing protein [Cupriavidus pauculus]|uniref:SAM-dependent methyltransferase n=1 Tax=Cupriavidus pauculus TaxID=82633 RepID=A0A2N5CH32_9BURK|nr:methyltransferase domain-containing protein [Cupriavidus pauculus]PLQ01532.1 SAM-dependent methyltransferase [Cupriavidus pauculus]
MNELLSPVASYYTQKIKEFGPQPKGVDWNGEDGQLLRFQQLCQVLDPAAPFSIVDVGCGYGALFDFLLDRFQSFEYIGIDISETMIETARDLHKQKPQGRFVTGTAPEEPVDFAVASGIFNVRLGGDEDAWKAYIRETLTRMNQFTKRGFAFNCLTSYSDADRMRPDLHYADPCELFDLCKRTFSRNVALLHDYGLYEFTIVVRK